MIIDARGLHYQELNNKVHRAVAQGAKRIVLKGVNGQRYIGGGIQSKVNITIKGVPGNDLAAFADGPTIVVESNAQDAVANTMNKGKIVIRGDAGDVLGYGMRGGRLFVGGDVGYRVGIHMKAYQRQVPIIVIGGQAQDFLGEYMAGGVIVVLGLKNGDGQPIVGNFTGTGMHGGKMYIRSKIEPYQLGAEVSTGKLNDRDRRELERYLKEYCRDFKLDLKKVLSKDFIKLIPHTHRPYGEIYCY